MDLRFDPSFLGPFPRFLCRSSWGITKWGRWTWRHHVSLFWFVDATDYFRYTDQEIEAFKSIMRLERGFRTIVSACTGDVRHLLALINKVCAYVLLSVWLKYFQGFASSMGTSIRRHNKIEIFDSHLYSRGPKARIDLCAWLRSTDTHCKWFKGSPWVQTYRYCCSSLPIAAQGRFWKWPCVSPSQTIGVCGVTLIN